MLGRQGRSGSGLSLDTGIDQEFDDQSPAVATSAGQTAEEVESAEPREINARLVGIGEAEAVQFMPILRALQADFLKLNRAEQVGELFFAGDMPDKLIHAREYQQSEANPDFSAGI